jgi:hypothetical protein
MSEMQRQIENFVSTLNREFAAHSRPAEREQRNSLIPVIRFSTGKTVSRG